MFDKNKRARLRLEVPCREVTVIPAAILIADDDANILQALSFLVRRQGYSVRTACDGEQTLKALAEAVPDLLLLDLMMPHGNGYEVCRRVREDPALAAMRIIMLTARGRDEDQQHGLTLGADAYVTKPFAVRDVLDCVARVLAAPARTALPPGH